MQTYSASRESESIRNYNPNLRHSDIKSQNLNSLRDSLNEVCPKKGKNRKKKNMKGDKGGLCSGDGKCIIM